MTGRSNAAAAELLFAASERWDFDTIESLVAPEAVDTRAVLHDTLGRTQRRLRLRRPVRSARRPLPLGSATVAAVMTGAIAS